MVTESENYHFSDDQTDAILSSDQADSFFDEDIIAIDPDSSESLGPGARGTRPNVPKVQECNADIEIVEAPEKHFDESATDGASTQTSISDEETNTPTIDDPSWSMVAKLDSSSNSNDVIIQTPYHRVTIQIAPEIRQFKAKNVSLHV